MTNETEQHFEKWLAYTVREDIRDDVRQLMREQYELDPEFWDTVGWPGLYTTIHEFIQFE